MSKTQCEDATSRGNTNGESETLKKGQMKQDVSESIVNVSKDSILKIKQDTIKSDVDDASRKVPSEKELTQAFYGSYFLIRPIIDSNTDDMHFQFQARIHDEPLLNSLIPQLPAQNYKIQSQMASSQKTWVDPSDDFPSIKIPKVLVDSRLQGISQVIMSHGVSSIYPKDISREVNNVFSQNGQNQVIKELSQKLEQKQQQINLLLQFLPKNIMSQLEAQAINVENEIQVEKSEKEESENEDTNLNQSDQKSSRTISDEKQNLSEIQSVTQNESPSTPQIFRIEKSKNQSMQDQNLRCSEEFKNVHMSENLQKIQNYTMKIADIDFVKKIILKVCTNKTKSQSKEFKFKKWSLCEVGRLVFCLWEIHQRRASDENPRRSQRQSSNESSWVAVGGKRQRHGLGCQGPHSLNFYQSLKDLFNGFDWVHQDDKNQDQENSVEVQKHNSLRMKDIIYSKLQKQRESILKFEQIMQSSSTNNYKIDEFNKIESLIKILQGIREFADNQLSLGSSSILIKLRPVGSYQKSDSEYLNDILKAFKTFCLPQFLIKGDIYEKMFHEKLTVAKKNQVVTIAKNLWAIHQTFSTKGIAKLQDIDLEVLRSRQFAQANKTLRTSISPPQVKKRAKIKSISSDIQMEEFKNLRLSSDNCKNSGSFQTFGKTISPDNLCSILHQKKSLLCKRSQEKSDSFVVNKKQKLNGTLMNFLIDASNQANKTTSETRLKEFQLFQKSFKFVPKQPSGGKQAPFKHSNFFGGSSASALELMNGGYNNSSNKQYKKPYQEIDSIIDTEQMKWDKFRKLKTENVVSPAKMVRPMTKLKNFQFENAK